MATDFDNGAAESDMTAMLLYTLLAATFDAVSDTISDEVVGEECYASPRPSSGARKTRNPVQSAARTIASVPGTPRYGNSTCQGLVGGRDVGLAQT